MTKKRTSLTLTADALDKAQQRREVLGYDSVSEYIEFLILEDDRQKRRHTITRDENGVHHEATSDTSDTTAELQSLFQNLRNTPGKESTGESPDHLYASPGSHSLRLNEPSDFHDAGTAQPGQPFPGERNEETA